MPTIERTRSGSVCAIGAEHVVVEAVLLVPQAHAADAVHRVGDGHEMLEEFRGDVFVRRIFDCQFQRHRKHGRAVERHPGGAVRLFEVSAGRQRLRAIEHADVVEAQEAAGKQVLPLRVLAIHPPGEIHQQLVKRPLEE